jgi:hypothetical protein
MKSRCVARWIREAVEACMRLLSAIAGQKPPVKVSSRVPIRALSDQSFFILESAPAMSQPHALDEARVVLAQARKRFEQGELFRAIGEEIRLGGVVCSRIVEEPGDLSGFHGARTDLRKRIHFVSIFPRSGE